jgi:hypothetical protein
VGLASDVKRGRRRPPIYGQDIGTLSLCQRGVHHRYGIHRLHISSSCGICGAKDLWRYSLLECTMVHCVWALCDEERLERMCQKQDLKWWSLRLYYHAQSSGFQPKSHLFLYVLGKYISTRNFGIDC